MVHFYDHLGLILHLKSLQRNCLEIFDDGIQQTTEVFNVLRGIGTDVKAA